MSTGSNFPQQVLTEKQMFQQSPQSSTSRDGYSDSNFQQFSEEQAEFNIQKDTVYKKVSDLFASLKQGEDDAQI